MIIKKYGIVLRRITEDDIELLREKRNQDTIRNYMFYREVITPEQQRDWFKSINNIYNYYFIIEVEGKKVGLINGKNIDYEKRTSEGGIFVWDENYRDVQISAIASFIMAEFTFMMFKFNATYAEVLASNVGQVKYNEFMGYVLEKKEGEKLTYVLTKDNYLTKRKRLLRAIQNLCKDNSEISWRDLDFSKTEKQILNQLNSDLPDYIKKELKHSHNIN